MKFYVHRTPTIMSGLVIRWNPDDNLDAEISASRDAVCVSGFWDLKSPTDIAKFRTALAQAEEARHLLARGREHAPARYENEVDMVFGETLEAAVDSASQKEQAGGE